MLSMTGAEKIIEKILADARTDVQNLSLIHIFFPLDFSLFRLTPK